MQYHKGKSYQNKPLQEENLDNNPIISLNQWINEAKTQGIEDYNAFHLSTTDLRGNVSGRIVLLKSIEDCKIIFFTDYASKKGQQILINPKVAATFYWGKLERQVRIEGTIMKTTDDISDHYFSTRPKESQAAAAASNQSEKIENRKSLEEKFKKEIKSDNIKRPITWGGYEISPNYIEFWQGRPNRLNDRIAFSKNDQSWEKFRLAP